MSESILSINLKKFRRENNLTQQELAEMLDVSDKSISKWELGHTYPSKKNMINIANVLNISVELLLLEELTEENQNTKKLSKNKLISLLVIGCLLFISLNIYYGINLIKEKDNQIQKLQNKASKQNELLNRTYSYKIVVLLEPNTSEETITEWENLLKNQYRISKFQLLPNKLAQDIMIDFTVQAKNNDEMNIIFKEIKESAPNLKNIESFYL
ncbi:helix-turn-helix domain-containing protein [Vagococcus carniphilus]|uniref:HTH cro/C1-type domain-containing protein n=1 Tax=Vagococcus carniphilus TaxID=218144 RepID=A0A430B6H7_9ENTE|nr:helix-turn-helix transcriptional regulator [Vagococcus carniphilus]QNN72803.1 helix-turn-helix transcriptional regulator [Vagococcus carniphilus]RSU15909.1 hypothetical protein CBF28_05605 [Vagococcus carniphilus]